MADGCDHEGEATTGDMFAAALAMSHRDLVDRLGQVEAEAARLERERLALVAAFDSSQGYEAEGSKSAKAWLAWHGAMSSATASGLVRDARAFRDHPGLADAADELGVAKARVLARAAKAGQGTFTEALADLVGWVRPLSVDDTATAVRFWLAFADADGSKPTDDTGTFHCPAAGGTIRFSGSAAGAEAWEIHRMVTARAQAYRRAEAACDDGTPATPIGVLRFRALRDLTREGWAATDGTKGTPALPLVMVDIALPTLLGWDDDPATIIGYGPISADDARMLACDSLVSRVITGAASATLDMGRATRDPSPHQRRAVAKRDRCCTVPGCGEPAHRCDVHHIDEWDHGGPTDLANLCLCCRRHHRMVHLGLLTIEPQALGPPTVTRADGTTIERRPPHPERDQRDRDEARRRHRPDPGPPPPGPAPQPPPTLGQQPPPRTGPHPPPGHAA